VNVFFSISTRTTTTTNSALPPSLVVGIAFNDELVEIITSSSLLHGLSFLFSFIPIVGMNTTNSQLSSSGPLHATIVVSASSTCCRCCLRRRVVTPPTNRTTTTPQHSFARCGIFVIWLHFFVFVLLHFF